MIDPEVPSNRGYLDAAITHFPSLGGDFLEHQRLQKRPAKQLSKSREATDTHQIR